MHNIHVYTLKVGIQTAVELVTETSKLRVGCCVCVCVLFLGGWVVVVVVVGGGWGGGGWWVGVGGVAGGGGGGGGGGWVGVGGGGGGWGLYMSEIQILRNCNWHRVCHDCS